MRFDQQFLRKTERGTRENTVTFSMVTNLLAINSTLEFL